MISAYYKNIESSRHFSTRPSILKDRHMPFVIPSHHLNISDESISHLHGECQKYQSEVSFIKDEIERQARLKKEKSADNSSFQKSKLHRMMVSRQRINRRHQRRDQLGITDLQLRKLATSKRDVQTTKCKLNGIQTQKQNPPKNKYIIHAVNKKKHNIIIDPFRQTLSDTQTFIFNCQNSFVFPKFRQGKHYKKVHKQQQTSK